MPDEPVHLVSDSAADGLHVRDLGRCVDFTKRPGKDRLPRQATGAEAAEAAETARRCAPLRIDPLRRLFPAGVYSGTFGRISFFTSEWSQRSVTRRELRLRLAGAETPQRAIGLCMAGAAWWPGVRGAWRRTHGSARTGDQARQAARR